MGRKRKLRKKKMPVATISVPRGTKIKVKKTKGNPYVLQVGGKTRKIRLAAGRIKEWKDV